MKKKELIKNLVIALQAVVIVFAVGFVVGVQYQDGQQTTTQVEAKK